MKDDHITIMIAIADTAEPNGNGLQRISIPLSCDERFNILLSTCERKL